MTRRHRSLLALARRRDDRGVRSPRSPPPPRRAIPRCRQPLAPTPVTRAGKGGSGPGSDSPALPRGRAAEWRSRRPSCRRGADGSTETPRERSPPREPPWESGRRQKSENESGRQSSSPPRREQPEARRSEVEKDAKACFETAKLAPPSRAGCSVTGGARSGRRTPPEGTRARSARYSQAIRHGDLLWCSGAIPLDRADGSLVDRLARDRDDALPAEPPGRLRKPAGTDLARALRLTVYTTQLDRFAEINEAYGAFFAADPAGARDDRRRRAAEGRRASRSTRSWRWADG